MKLNDKGDRAYIYASIKHGMLKVKQSKVLLRSIAIYKPLTISENLALLPTFS